MMEERAVIVVAFDRATQAAVQGAAEEAAGCVDVRLWKGRTADVGGAGVVIGVTPSASEEWAWLEVLCSSGIARVVVANGVFSNGVDWLEPVFYLKPCSGWGCLLRDWPSPFEAVSARTGLPLSGVEITLLTQGRLRRPDLATASRLLSSDYNGGGQVL
jgi:hypothetical protein